MLDLLFDTMTLSIQNAEVLEDFALPFREAH